MEEQIVMVEKILFAALLGGIIGWERELKNKPAGLRTHILIAAAACALMELGVGVLTRVEGNNVTPDPIRIVQAIIIGIGFVAGGVSSAGKDEDNNLTTAATVLFVATIGITVGISQFVVAIALTVLNLIINTVLLRIEAKINKKNSDG